MSSPKFAEMHNVIVFLEKLVESDGFAEIIDFLKASSVHYALTVNLIIYTSCIEQFWTTSKVKKLYGVASQRILDCLLTATIFEELARMGFDLEKAKDDQQKRLCLKKRIRSWKKKCPTPIVDETQERQDDELMFDTGVLDTDEMPVEAKVDEKDEQSTKLDDSTAGEAVTTASVEDSVAPTTIEEITLAQTLIQIKAAKPKVVTTAATTTTTTRPKAKGVVVQEPSEFRVPQEAQPSISKDKGKGIMVEPEVPLKRKDQIALDEQIARDIQAKLDAEIIEEQKLARKQEEEANIALIESWENTQAMMEADRLLAERLQSKEREELTDEEKGKLFMELIEKRRKHFAALKAQEKRNRPPTKAQKRTQMSTYLKHMGKQRKEGSEQTAKGSRKKMLGRKRARKEQQQESLKKQRIEEDKESNEVDEVSKDDEGELMKHLVIKKDEMSEAEPIPPTSSVTALRIPMIKKGEYDLCHNDSWSASDQNFTAANARRNNEKALNILLSAIPDRHLLSFHDATNAKTLWTAIKARFGGNEASKKMQKNLLKQQFETFTIGSREELDSAYERFQNILSMLELYDAKVSLEDANLKFLRSLPSVWHVVATMIRGQPGLDELEFDDLYNNLKVYEHELKGVSFSSQNIAFLSTEVKGSTLKQSTADPTNIPKGYTQAASSKMQTAPNCASHSDEIICSFFAQQALYAYNS
ncbi:hypothetical protein Tco_0659235 [Tanacetum coccineum]